MIVELPIPEATHKEIKATFLFDLSSSSRAVPRIIVPVAPKDGP